MRRAGREGGERWGTGHCPPISPLRVGSGSSGGVPGVRRVKLESVVSIDLDSGEYRRSLAQSPQYSLLKLQARAAEQLRQGYRGFRPPLPGQNQPSSSL